MRIFARLDIAGHLIFLAIIFDFVHCIVSFHSFGRVLGRSGLRRLEFLVRFLERLLDQADDELLLGEFAVVDLLVAGQVLLDLLEEFLADLEGHCPCFAHCGCSFRVMLQDDLFDELAHCAFVLLDFLGDAIMQIEWNLAGHAFGFH